MIKKSLNLTLLLNIRKISAHYLAAATAMSVFIHASSVLAASTTTTVEVNIVSTINLVAQNGIVFGDISSSDIPGSVTIGTDSSRTTTGGVTINSNVSATPALYEVSGDPNVYYTITLPQTVILTSAAGDSMVVDNFSSFPSVNGQLDSGGRQNLNIGARLNVGSLQPFGAYQGVMSTSVDYD